MARPSPESPGDKSALGVRGCPSDARADPVVLNMFARVLEGLVGILLIVGCELEEESEEGEGGEKNVGGEKGGGLVGRDEGGESEEDENEVLDYGCGWVLVCCVGRREGRTYEEEVEYLEGKGGHL
jgi:hypothetical protein